MNVPEMMLWRRCALLAINLLFLMVWGFTSLDKLVHGIPPWFSDKFGKTFLATFPGLSAGFWILAGAELVGFGLAIAALLAGEFLGRRPLRCLTWMLVWSLFVFVQLGFGQWLTSEYNGTAQLFTYFCGTVITLQFVTSSMQSESVAGSPRTS